MLYVAGTYLLRAVALDLSSNDSTRNASTLNVAAGMLTLAAVIVAWCVVRKSRMLRVSVFGVWAVADLILTIVAMSEVQAFLSGDTTAGIFWNFYLTRELSNAFIWLVGVGAFAGMAAVGLPRRHSRVPTGSKATVITGNTLKQDH